MISRSFYRKVDFRIIFFVFLFLITQVHAQSIEVSKLDLDVFASEPFEVTFTIKGATRDMDFIPPNFKPFKVIQGPNRSTNTEVLNGRVNTNNTISYILMHDRIGTFNIGSATLKSRKFSKKTKNFKVEILKSTKSNKLKGNNIFLDMTLSDSTIYVGQQLLIDHDVYYGDIKVEGSKRTSSIVPEKYILEEILNGKTIPRSSANINGGKRNKAKISRLAIFALRSGEISIPDLEFEVDFKRPNSRSNSFFNRNYIKKSLQSEGVAFTVEPLPPGAPESFTGCVGQLTGTSEISKGPFSVGQEILVNLELRGSGISEQITAPIWTQAGLEIFEAKLLGENKIIENGEIVFTKIYQYLVIPRIAKQVRLEIPFSSFNPKTGKYEENKSSSVLLKVGESATKLVDATDKNLNVGNSILDSATYKKPWFWGILILGISGIVFFLMRKGNKSPKVELTIEEAALIVAQRKLSFAKDLLDTGNTGEYWETLENSLRIYLEEKLEIGTTDYSIAEISERWEKASLKPDLLDQWKGMVDKINLARYAGQSISDMENLYKEALDWIVKVEV